MNQKDLYQTVITERMEWYYQKFNEKGKKESEFSEDDYQKIVEKLSKEERRFLSDYIDSKINEALDYNEKFYHAGIHDGLRIDRYIKDIKNKEE